MTKAEKKQLAYNLFIKSALNRKEIARQVGITEVTLRRWIEDNEWQKLKDAQEITRPKLLQEAYNQLAAVNKVINEQMNGVPNKEMSDVKSSIRKEIEIFSLRPIHKYVEVFEEYIAFLSKHYPNQINEFTQTSQEFIHQLSLNESSR